MGRVYTEAHRQYARDYHAKHREQRNANARQKRYENKLRAIEYKGGKCFDCHGAFHPAVYDFHHLDSTQKDFNLGTLMNWNWGRQQEELDKCVLLCSNCHRIRHHGESTDI